MWIILQKLPSLPKRYFYAIFGTKIYLECKILRHSDQTFLITFLHGPSDHKSFIFEKGEDIKIVWNGIRIWFFKKFLRALDQESSILKKMFLNYFNELKNKNLQFFEKF